MGFILTIFAILVLIGVISGFNNYSLSIIFKFIWSGYIGIGAIIICFQCLGLASKEERQWIWVKKYSGRFVRNASPQESDKFERQERLRNDEESRSLKKKHGFVGVILLKLFEYLMKMFILIAGILLLVGSFYGWKVILS